MKKLKRKKLKSLRSLKNLAWYWFSIWVRKSASDWKGYTACVCCGAVSLWNSGDIHAGHWIHDKLDYDERNVHPQCKNCNYKFNKNTNTFYAIFMAKTYGVLGMEQIRKDATEKGNNYSRFELMEIIEKYKALA